MEEVRENDVRSYKDVRIQKASICLLWGEKGLPLYQKLRDCLFRAPDEWTLMRCLGCKLVLLNPRLIPQGVGKLYAEYFTHAPARRVNTRLMPVQRAIERGVLAKSRLRLQPFDSWISREDCGAGVFLDSSIFWWAVQNLYFRH